MENKINHEERADLAVKIESFKRLEKVFKEFCEQTKLFLSTGTNSEVVGLSHVPNDEFALIGFGHRIVADWRFLLHNGQPYGELRFYLDSGDTNEIFFKLYFNTNGDSNIDINNLSCEFYLIKSKDMEVLYFTVLKNFFALGCFKA